MRVRPWIVVPLVVLASCGSSAANSGAGSTSTSGATSNPAPGATSTVGATPAPGATSTPDATSTASATSTPGATPIPTRCGPASATTLAGDGRVRVYASGQVVYGCSAARGRSFRLGHVSRSIREARVGPVAVAGNLAAYGLTSFGIDTVRASVVVRRLTDGAQLGQLSATRAVGAESFQSIGSIVVTADGAVAWIGSESSIVGHRHATEVHATGAAGAGDRILDSGPGIDPTSLRLHGSSLSWVDGGVTHRSKLR